MSWLRSAVNKAVEVGNKNNLTRTVKSYADSVVQHAGQAVADGAKLLQDRIVARNFRSAKLAIKRLEEVSVACRGPERTQLLRKWVIVLQEIEKLSRGSSEDRATTLEHYLASDESNDNTRRPSLIMYSDSEVGGEPMNFRDVFLQSQALEGITLSMILEAPTEEEICLLLEMFRLCLTGGKEIHNAIVSSIQDLAQAFTSYQDEVLVKREELLQFAQSAITGLKINAYLGRIDAEVCSLKKKLEEASKEHSSESRDKESIETIESLKKALAWIQICSKLEGLLLKKKLITSGDSSDIHAQKVDKLKILSESLSSSSGKAEKRILDNRSQKEEALNVRVAKASEVNEREKELAAEISGLQKQRDELEDELKKVNISLAAANARLRNTREERDQFEEANNQIVAHLKTKENELSKSIASCRAEAGVLNRWINFLEDTWVLQCTYTEIKEKQFNDELEKHENYFVILAIDLLSSYKKELGHAISRIKTCMENLSEGSQMEPSVDNEDPKVLNPRRNLEEEYLDYENKIIATFSVVDTMKEQLYAEQGKISSKDDRVKELFDDVGKLREQFGNIERPILSIETPTPKAEAQSSDNREDIPTQRAETQSLEKIQDSPAPPMQVSMTEKEKVEGHPVADKTKAEDAPNPEAELAMLESEFGNIGPDNSAQEINDWEFDELERELRKGDSEITK